MTDKKLPDSEIVKALPKMLNGGHGCKNCKYDDGKGDDRCGLKGCKIARYALDLINRLQAENESLEIALTNARDNLGDTRAELNKYETLYELSLENEKAYKTAIDGWKQRLETTKAEAYKEFAERLKAVYEGFDDKNEVILYSNLLTAIDCLLIGMVGDNNSEFGMRNSELKRSENNDK